MTKILSLKKISSQASIIILILVISTSFGAAIAQSQTSVALAVSGDITYSPTADVTVTVNPTQIIGTNNFSLGFMLDFEWQKFIDRPALQTLAQEANYKLVRIFDWRNYPGHSADPCISWDESTKTGTYDWTDVDALISSIYSIGAEPLITLGSYTMTTSYIPKGMAINPTTGIPNPNSWAAYCRDWVEHFDSVGFPVQYYEIVNEGWAYWYSNWNLDLTKLGYMFDLYHAAYNEMHSANPNVMIGNDASTLIEYVDYWIAHDGKMDFISFHKYDCDGTHMGDKAPLDRAETRHFVRMSYWYGVNDVRQKYYEKYGVILPAINSESNFAAVYEGTDPRIQQVVGTVWNALTVKSCILYDVQYMIYYSMGSSASYEQTKPTGGLGFGMINLDDNKPWYPYYFQELIGENLKLQDKIVYSASSSTDIPTMAWLNDGTLNILLISKIDQPRSIIINGIEGEAKLFKIDDSISYFTPSVQTDNVNLTHTLNTLGYTVFLVQITA